MTRPDPEPDPNPDRERREEARRGITQALPYPSLTADRSRTRHIFHPIHRMEDAKKGTGGNGGKVEKGRGGEGRGSPSFLLPLPIFGGE